MKLIMSLSIVLVFISSYAEAKARYDMHKAFIKVNKGFELPKTDLITNAKVLFAGNYLVKTSNVLELEAELKIIQQ